MRRKYKIYITIFIVILIGVPIIAFLLYDNIAMAIYLIGILITSPEEPQFDCSPIGELTEEYDIYVNETWVESDKIRSYEDIPEKERRNLSEDAKRFLRDSARVDYTPRDYENLSERERSVFMKAINANGSIDIETMPDRSVILSEYVNLTDDDVRYLGMTYECRRIPTEWVDE